MNARRDVGYPTFEISVYAEKKRTCQNGVLFSRYTAWRGRRSPTEADEIA
jgi:hypothetical protein